MRLAAMIGIGVAVLIALLTWVVLSPDRQASMAEPVSIGPDDVRLTVDLLGWGLTRKELRAALQERGYSVRRQAAATLGFRHDVRIFSLAYEVTNNSNEVLAVFGGGTIGLGGLPIVTGSEKGDVRLSLTTELDPNVDFVRQPHIGGDLLAPGETFGTVLSIPYPLEDQWKRGTNYEPKAITFCVGLTTDTQGIPASSLGDTGSSLYWPMGAPAPIEVCKDVTR